MLTAAQVAGLFDNLLYINVHSTFWPGGEIRGQIIVPSPGALAMLGIAGLSSVRRRRR